MSRIFLDTNALLDFVLVRDTRSHAALQQILESCTPERDSLLTSALSLKDASYVIEESRYGKEVIPDNKRRKRVSKQLRDIILDTFEIVPVDEVVCRHANENSSEPSFDDALIAESAQLAAADVIISADKHAFKHSVVPKMSAEEYLRTR